MQQAESRLDRAGFWPVWKKTPRARRAGPIRPGSWQTADDTSTRPLRTASCADLRDRPNSLGDQLVQPDKESLRGRLSRRSVAFVLVLGNHFNNSEDRRAVPHNLTRYQAVLQVREPIPTLRDDDPQRST